MPQVDEKSAGLAAPPGGVPAGELATGRPLVEEIAETLRLLGEEDLARDPAVLAALESGAPVELAASPTRPASDALAAAAREAAVWRGLASSLEMRDLAERLLAIEGDRTAAARSKALILLRLMAAERPLDFKVARWLASALLTFPGFKQEAAAVATACAEAIELWFQSRIPASKHLNRLASLWRLAQNVDAELAAMERRMQSYPADVGAERLRLAALLHQAGRPADALDALKQTFELPLDVDVKVRAIGMIADLYGVEAAIEAALGSEAILKDPDFVRTAMRYLMLAGRYDEAADIGRRVDLACSDSPAFPAKLQAMLGRVVRPPAGKFLIKIVAAVAVPGLGDFLMQLALVATLKLRFRNCRAVLVTLPLTDGEQSAVDCCPYFDEHVIAESAKFAGVVEQLGRDANYIWDRKWIQGAHVNLETYAPRARLVIPPARRADLHQSLLARGLDPNRWVVGMHCRHNSSYLGDPSGGRDVDPNTFYRLIDYIVDELGGQVAWLGHPGAPTPSRDGVILLNTCSMMEQYYAIAVSRYFVGCDSGPVMVASGFQTPVLKSNSLYDSGGWNEDDIILFKNILTADAKVLSFADIAQMSPGSATRPGYVLWIKAFTSHDDFIMVDNSFEQLRHCVDLLHAKTSGVSALRSLQEKASMDDPPNELIVSPVAILPSAHILDLTHMLGRPVIRARAPGATPSP